MEQSLVLKEEEITLSVADVRKHIAPNATEKELFMFLNIARSYGLNPFKREIHFVKYGNAPGSIIVGYETYLKRAERTSLLDGWSVKVLDKGKDTERAEITIHRKDQGTPFVWEVFRSEFDKGQSTWKAMPQFMLKKVAIAQGFRLAFPLEMGGMPYIPEEISSGGSEQLPMDEGPPPEPTKVKELIKPKPKKPSKEEFDFIASCLKAKEVLGDKTYYTILGVHGYEHSTDIPKTAQDAVMEDLRIEAKKIGEAKKKEA